MKKINLNSITQKEILQIEKQFERIALNKIRIKKSLEKWD